MWRWPGGKSAALALSLPGSIPGHSPIFRVALALLLLIHKLAALTSRDVEAVELEQKLKVSGVNCLQFLIPTRDAEAEAVEAEAEVEVNKIQSHPLPCYQLSLLVSFFLILRSTTCLRLLSRSDTHTAIVIFIKVE